MALIHTLIGNVKGPAGAAGQNFEYKKTYASVSAMNNDYSGTDTSVGDYVIIAANDLSDADNGKVYRKGNSSWVYVVQVAGPRGAKGDPGPLCPLVNNFNTTISGQGALDAALGPEIKTGDTQNNVVTFTSSDVQDSEAASWTSVTPLATGETHTSLMGKLSQFAKNIRFLYKLLGTTDISGIGSGTVTDILSALNTNKFDKSHVLNNLTTPASQTGYALDAREGKVLNDNISSLNDALTNRGKFTRAAVCTNTTAVASSISDWSDYKYLFIAAVYDSQTLDCKFIPITLITADAQFRSVFVGSALGSSKRYAKVNITATLNSFTCAIFDSLTSVRIYGVK